MAKRKRPARKAAKTKAADAGGWRTKVAMARHYGVSRNSVDKWTSRPDFPGGRRGPWRQSEVDGYLERIRSPLAPTAAEAQPTDVRQLGEQRLRAEVAKLLEDARGKKLRNDLFAGRLVERDQAERNAAEMCLRIKQRLEALSGELRMLFPRELQVKICGEIDEKIRLVLIEMSNWEIVE